MKFSLKRFFNHDIWEIEIKKLPGYLRVLLNALRVVTLAIRGFMEDKIQQKASALTFYSLLSVVPIFAMVFGIAKGFGLEQKLKDQILSNAAASQQQEVITWVVDFAQSMLDSTKGGIVAGVGIVILLWSVMSILGNIEASFNDIWRIKKSRNMLRKFTDYMAIMILAPVLLASSSSLTVFISTQVDHIARKVEAVSFIASFTDTLLEFAPYVLIWLVFFLVYLVMPNTRVSWKSALMGGIIAGSFFQVFEWAYINFQVGVARYNAIYGSFAALPLFLIWLQTSWNLVLLGCEISFASQNYHRFAFEGSIKNLSIEFKKVLGLQIFLKVSDDFNKGVLRDKDEYYEMLNMPPRLFSAIVEELINYNLLVEVEKDKLFSLHPAKDSTKMTLAQFNEMIELGGVNKFPGIMGSKIDLLHNHYKMLGEQGVEKGNISLSSLQGILNSSSEIS